MISSRLSRLSNELKGTFKDGLDKGFSSSKLKQEFRCAIDDVKPDLQDIVDKELNVLREELKVEMNRLHERMNLRLFVTDFDLPDMDEILRDASLSVGREVIDVLLSVLGIVLLALANIIAAIVAGVMAVLRKLWEWFGGGKRKRKRAARTKARRQIGQRDDQNSESVGRHSRRRLGQIGGPSLATPQCRGSTGLSLPRCLHQSKRKRPSLSTPPPRNSPPVS